MAFFDLPLDQLERYRPEREEPADFDEFWAQSLAEARLHPLEARFVPVDFGLRTVESYDVSFAGYGGQPIRGWLLVPRIAGERKLPCVVEFMGYGIGRGFPTESLFWSSCGFVHLLMDTRAQGCGWRSGATPDGHGGSASEVPGYMTRGILDPHAYFYRRVFVDAVRAVEAARAFDRVESERLAVTGISQGGGITLAVAGLDPGVAAALPDVPFLCHYRRALAVTDSAPYRELRQFLQIHRNRKEEVFHTLSYFDGVNFAARARARAFFSVGLMDDICPPSTVYAAFNHYQGEKQINVWEYNGHEGGDGFQGVDKIRFLNRLWES